MPPQEMGRSEFKLILGYIINEGQPELHEVLSERKTTKIRKEGRKGGGEGKKGKKKDRQTENQRVIISIVSYTGNSELEIHPG